jgi:hypothetical protein
MSAQTVKSETTGGGAVRIVAAWLFVGVPLAWGVYATMRQAALLFR